METVQKLILVLSIFVTVTVSTDLYKQVGFSVQLDIQNSDNKDNDFSWRFNKENIIIKYYPKINLNNVKTYGPYKVEFNTDSYSLTLKNIQKNQSGLYEAVNSSQTDKTVATYRLHVLDPVDSPVLSAVPHQLINDTCNVTFTCRGHDRSISSTYYNETFEEKNETSPAHITLSLSVRGSTIICNQSNPISWKQHVLSGFREHCSHEEKNNVLWLHPVFASLLILLAIALNGIYQQISSDNEAVLTKVVWHCTSTTAGSSHCEKEQTTTKVEYKQVP
ncbi:SLAM family member 5-like [Hoplias malabaricus]|uniref:SLAM family member 5-like n=1 Tax=Hoplias malabaricus TaxID=27720 RepID=UPI003462424F